MLEFRRTCTIKEWNKNSSAHPILIELLSGSVGWGAGLQSSRLAQGKSSNLLKVLIKENKVIYQMYKSAKFGLVSYCHYISLTLPNSDPVE